MASLTTSLLLVILSSHAFAMRMPIDVDESSICEQGNGQTCKYEPMKYERIIDVQPGFQWHDAGGYCGAWSIQRGAMAKGAYISEQQVRDHTSPGGGHDNEILSTNIDEALRNLKISAEGFDFDERPLPQMPAYFEWLKRHLANGDPVLWMIMWNNRTYPIYNLTAPAGMYGHVEPVIGIQSNHPLDNTTVFDDDVVLHYTDNGIQTVRRRLTSMDASSAWDGRRADCGSSPYCMGPYAFGWAVHGFLDDAVALPASLRIEPSNSEPDTRNGEHPGPLNGTLHVSGLTVGISYDIYRWDTVEDAFAYDHRFKKTSFRAEDIAFIYEDSQYIQSDGTTYYKCVPSLDMMADGATMIQ